jgi:dihydrofolate reductase
MKISIIVAVAENGVIGAGNQLIWHLPEDLKNFKRLTTGHHIIMGRKTYESIGRPLPNRVNVIVTRNRDYEQERCLFASSLEQAVNISDNGYETESFIIGGGEIYRQALPLADKIYLTRVHQSFEGDVYFPELDENEWKILNKKEFQPDEKHKYPFTIFEMERKGPE